MELIDIFMRLIGESCPQLKLCTILLENIIDVQRVQKHWINLIKINFNKNMSKKTVKSVSDTCNLFKISKIKQ